MSTAVQCFFSFFFLDPVGPESLLSEGSAKVRNIFYSAMGMGRFFSLPKTVLFKTTSPKNLPVEGAAKVGKSFLFARARIKVCPRSAQPRT
ncbi:hypothetical protein DC20_01715 [Rufibacter tibetensis]|uniref:Uncharacterized protein n=1 Tax=Rufibacter tibetensis TaxID=512763 RepID=A0A0P0CFY3_9BACT|nr:hypothetical protein DC20_01715 [Rufibacter tibetensis]